MKDADEGYINLHWIDFLMNLQVVGAKVVTNARSPGARCYGFVTMCSTEEATKCIDHLHRTELHGRMISVERVSVLLQHSVSLLYGII